MEFSFHTAVKEIWFDVTTGYGTSLDEIAFVGLIQSRFNADVCYARRHGKGKGAVYDIKLIFRNSDDYFNAQAHCKNNVAVDGRIAIHYIGALEHADPGRRYAKVLRSAARDGVERK